MTQLQRFVSLWAILCLLVVPMAWAAEAGTVIEGKVVSIADGDTITVLTLSNEQVKVRLHGIDCPESGQPFGTKAKEFTGKFCHEKMVRVEVTDTDRYGRIVGNVLVDGRKNLNHALVGAGLAWWYKQYAPKDLKLMKLHTDAIKERLGLWGASESPVAPWDWRRGQRGMSVSNSADISNTETPQYKTSQPERMQVHENPTPYSPNLNSNSENTPAATAQPQSTAGQVFITDTGEKYHRDGCRYLKSKISISKANAQARGYEACKGCRP